MKLARGTPYLPLLPVPIVLLSVLLCDCMQPVFSSAISAVTLLLAALYLLFFRDPDRRVCSAPVCSPADGVVQSVEETDEGWRIAVFMNIHNVHVNRSPVSGKITEVIHTPGSHLPAFRKESERNERVIYEMETEYGHVRVVQIAGIVARRIVPYASHGDTVKKGERIGLIRFGSRVDTYLPKCFAPAVNVGDKVRTGESPLADLSDNKGGTE